LRSLFWLPGEPRRNLMAWMPSERSGPPGQEALAMKVLTLFPGNHARGLDSHLGFVLLFDGQSGEPLAILDASSVTGIRTAAASALATRLLAREDAADLASSAPGCRRGTIWRP